MDRGDPETVYGDYPALRCRDRKVEMLSALPRDIDVQRGIVRNPGFDPIARHERLVAQREAQRTRAKREGWWRVRGVHGRALEVPMAQVHRDQAETTEEESQKQRQTVGVVESGDEHEEEQHTEP